MAGTKKIWIVSLFLLIGVASFGQVTSGKILFERKTNLKKLFGDDPRMSRFITNENKTKIDKFYLNFNDSLASFVPVPDEEEAQGFMKYLTQHNSVYSNLETKEKLTVMDLWGNMTYMTGPMFDRQWKITEKKRDFAGYSCRRAIWEMNDSTRIYAWFSVDLVPSFGPEGFNGLPGLIMGLATEDGSIIMFAKEVILDQPKQELLVTDPGKNEVYTKEELKAILAEKMGKWMKPKDLDGMFSWL